MYEPVPTNARRPIALWRWVLLLAVLLGLAIGYRCYYIDYWTRYPVLDYSKRLGCLAQEYSKKTDIVIYIPSPAQWEARRRQVMRKMRPELGGAHVWFIVGTLDGPRLERQAQGLAAVRKEAAEEPSPLVRYRFVPCRDFGDEPDNPNGTSSTTCKTYEALKFIAAHYASDPPRFVWRGADDAYLDLGVFRARIAPRLQTCRLFFGRVRFPTPLDSQDLELYPRQPKLYALFGISKFGKYVAGMGFLMSWDVVQFVGQSPIPPRLTWCEDVMVGQWLLFYDIDFVDFRSVNPRVGMVNGDEPPEHFPAILLAHRLSKAQWTALERRPRGDTSSEFLQAT